MEILMKSKVADYLIYDEQTGKYREDPEQMVRDDVEKHHWKHVGLTILKDWRLYLMLIPMILVFFFWRYMPMYELLGSFKVYDAVKGVALGEENAFKAAQVVGIAAFNDTPEHAEHILPEVFAVQDLLALGVDDLTLGIMNIRKSNRPQSG